MEPAENAAPVKPDRPRLYVVALSHLDTQWRWTVRETARDFLPRTVRENEDRFRRFANYRLNFEGACRYRLLAECHPAHFATVRKRVAEGRWYPAGAAWEAFDANLPAPESIVRQILHGTRFFRSALGSSGRDLFLPDCFGFPQALPTLAAHCGILGFSTQKLRRGREMRSAFGVPFALGRWLGPDGSELLSVLDPGEYGAQATADLAEEPEWRERFAQGAAAGQPPRLMTYQGLGDKGGALPARTLHWLERSLASDGEIQVVLADSEQIFRELTPIERERLPSYDGELLLRLHATGCYSSRSQLKRWHRKAEQLAHAAERAGAVAHLLGARNADRERLREAWLRILAHEMHDDLTGTSLPEAYRHSAHDLALSLNELGQELEAAVGALAGRLDDRAEGVPLVVFNPLGRERTDLVEIELPADGAPAGSLAVIAPDGREVPSQWSRNAETVRGCFVGHVPSLSFSRFDVRSSPAEPPHRTPQLAAGESFLENDLLRVEVDEAGDISRIYDKRGRRELLAAPVGLELLDDTSVRFPSWEIRYEDTSRPARARLAGGVHGLSVEHGAARAALRLEREVEGSRFVQTISLAAGTAGDQVVVDTTIHWRTDGTLLKMVFPLATPAEQALYDQGVGISRRPVATPGLYEVPAHQWAALRDATVERGAGVAIANDCKYGWDHPDESTLRLTLLHTPRIGRRFRYQERQDFGRHEVRVAIRPLAAGESIAAAVRFGERLNQPLRAFLTSAPLGAARTEANGSGKPRELSFLSLDDEGVTVQALKLAEDSDEVVLRLRECAGRSCEAGFQVSLPIVAQREIDGCEQPLDAPAFPQGVERKAPVKEQRAVSLKGFGLAAVALTFAAPIPVLSRHEARQTPCPLPWNLFAATSRGERARGGGLDGRGQTIPRELLATSIERAGVRFDLSHAHRTGEPSGLLCGGQQLSIAAGFSRLVLLTAAFSGELSFEFLVDGVALPLCVPGGFAPLGRFDEPARGLFGRPNGKVTSGFLSEEPAALALPHRHDGRGRIDPCRPLTFYRVELLVSPSGATLILPRLGRLVILAATLAEDATVSARDLSPTKLA